jgi:hypothetical protein
VTGLCLLAAGLVVGTVDTMTFVLAWQHSVEKTRWEESYRIEGRSLILDEAYVEGSGAGMEVPRGAQRYGRGWRWRPGVGLDQLVVAGSPYGGDYSLCAGGRCKPLRERSGRSLEGPIELKACAALPRPRP